MSTEKKAKSAPAPKAKKVKLVRDSFCMPKDEYAGIDALKARALGMGKAIKKSELLRAGILALTQATDKAFLAAIEAVPNLKTGRPAKEAAEVTVPAPEPQTPAVAAVAAPKPRRTRARKTPAAATESVTA